MFPFFSFFVAWPRGSGNSRVCRGTRFASDIPFTFAPSLTRITETLRALRSRQHDTPPLALSLSSIKHRADAAAHTSPSSARLFLECATDAPRRRRRLRAGRLAFCRVFNGVKLPREVASVFDMSSGYSRIVNDIAEQLIYCVSTGMNSTCRLIKRRMVNHAIDRKANRRRNMVHDKVRIRRIAGSGFSKVRHGNDTKLYGSFTDVY